MTTVLEERIAREEGRGEQQDMRLGELREDMRTGFERTDRAIAEVREDMRAGFERVVRAITSETTSIREDMRAGFERTDGAIDRLDRTVEGLRSELNTFRNLVIGGMITLGIGMIVLFLTIILRPPG
jgi:predicted translin family RNA/ssDNA-binding protein